MQTSLLVLRITKHASPPRLPDQKKKIKKKIKKIKVTPSWLRAAVILESVRDKNCCNLMLCYAQ